ADPPASGVAEYLVRARGPRARVQLILGAIVRSRVGVTRRARLAVAAHLRIPEERLAEDDRRRPGLGAGIQELTQVGYIRDRNVPEAAQSSLDRCLSHGPRIQPWHGLRVHARGEREREHDERPGH